MPRYEIKNTEQHCVEAYRRFKLARIKRRLALIVRFVLGATLLVSTITLLCLGIWLGVVVLAFVVVIYLQSSISEKRSIVRGLQGSPYRDEIFRIRLESDGFFCTNTKSDRRESWELFDAARQFDDGILLFAHRGYYWWLPNQSLTEGSLEDSVELLRQKISDFKADW